MIADLIALILECWVLSSRRIFEVWRECSLWGVGEEAPRCPAAGRKILVYRHLKGTPVVSLSGTVLIIFLLC